MRGRIPYFLFTWPYYMLCQDSRFFLPGQLLKTLLYLPVLEGHEGNDDESAARPHQLGRCFQQAVELIQFLVDHETEEP